MAARDRFGGFVEPAATPLQRYIQNACDPQNFEPNLALDLEIADLINSKKGNAPREAAMAIVSHVNNRNPNVSLLALTLLDICVKNCGYPFHLQISTKEFLNELVRRFPERPPIRYSRVQSKVLELIEEWRQTICQNSKYKEDLGFIRDMHRLLGLKGYLFPEIRREDAAVLNPSDNLKSAEEMEEEERAAQSAKLQELIRRGTPHDLQEANKLMKVMAGYDNRHKTDYRAKAADEVGRVQQKARILEEMLQERRQGDGATMSDGCEDLANALASAQPKIQKMCEEESDDTEAVAKLFEINDSIHRTLERYQLIKKGDIDAASRIPKGTLGTSGPGVRKGPDNELSLIDFGPEEASRAPTSKPADVGDSSLENDLLGLSMQENGSSSQGPISLDTMSPGISTSSAAPDLFSSPPLPTVPSVNQPTQPKFDFFDTIDSTRTAAQGPEKPPAVSNQGGDPFAALSSITPGRNSPFQYQQALKQPTTPSGNPTSAPNVSQASKSAGLAAASQVATSSGVAPIDDEWTFASALPDQAHEVVVTNSNIHVLFLISREPGSDNVFAIKSSISNNTSQFIADLTFQLAVMKGVTLNLEPQSGRTLQPHQRAGITQAIKLVGVEPGKGNTVKLRWKASYWVGGERRDEQGELSSLGLA